MITGGAWGRSGDWYWRERGYCRPDKGKWTSLRASVGQVQNDNEWFLGDGNVPRGRARVAECE